MRIRKDGIMQVNIIFVLGNNEAVKTVILDEAHKSAYAMHPASTKMYHTIRPYYYWYGMKLDIANYVSKCIVFQQVKVEMKKPDGLLQNLLIPAWKWEDIMMDFVYGLSKIRSNYDGISVIVDRLTKSAHFIPVRQNYKLEKSAIR